MRSRNHLAGIVATAAATTLGGGCTTVLYKGPQRPDSQIAVITSKDTIVDTVDRLNVREMAMGSFARLEILPGEHEVGISLNHVSPGFFVTTTQRSRPITVCVDLEAGHTYRTDAVIRGQQWIPRVIDLRTQRPIDPYCDDDAPSPVRVPPRPVAPAPGATAPAPVTAAPAPVATIPAPMPTAVAVAVAAPRTTPPSAPATAVRDAEDPRRSQRAESGDDRSSDIQARPSERRPGSGLSFTTGLAFGGDDFIKATSSNGDEQTLSAGGGFLIGIGAMVTPLWANENVGFGAGLDISVKYDSINASNGSASITRFPMALTVHLLTNGSGGPHYFFLKGGVIKDLDVNYSVSGVAELDASVTGSWGPTASFGYYKRSNDSFAWDILGFFALTNHISGPVKIDANSFGLSLGLHLNL